MCQAGGFYGPPFKVYQRVTQGEPLSPRIFNLMVDAVVHKWLRETLGKEAANSGIGLEIRRLLTAFYVDNGLIASRDPVLLQDAFNTPVGLFKQVGLVINTKKTEGQICTPGRIRVSLLTELYGNRIKGLSRLGSCGRPRVACDVCKMDLAVGSIRAHLEMQHSIFRSFVFTRDIVVEDRPAVTYRAQRETRTGGYICPVPDCPCPPQPTTISLRRNCWYRRPHNLVSAEKEGLLPMCRESVMTRSVVQLCVRAHL